MDVGSIFGALGGLQAGVEMARSALEARDQAKMATALSEIQSRLLDTQGQAFETQVELGKLIDANRALASRLALMETWETEKARYQLKDFGGGTYAYEMKPAAANGDPPHLLCANCFQKGTKSILQFKFMTGHSDTIKAYDCHACGKRTDLGTEAAPRWQDVGSGHDPGY